METRKPRHPLIRGMRNSNYPVITVENSEHWYELWVVHPDGRVTPLDFYELDENNIPNPTVLCKYSMAQNYSIDSRALELIVGRWYISEGCLWD
jgi:hypothetical protein